jgi:hypothetical protein
MGLTPLPREPAPSSRTGLGPWTGGLPRRGVTHPRPLLKVRRLCSEPEVAVSCRLSGRGTLPTACGVGEPSCRLPQDVEAVICVRGHLRKGTDDRLSVRPADLERLV